MLTVRYLANEPVFRTARLNLRGIGIREIMPPCYIRRPTGSGDCLFMIFHDPVHLGEHGKALHEPGTMMLWNQGQPQFYGNPQARWNHSWVHCGGPEIAEALKAARVPCGKPLHVANPSAIERCLLAIHEELTGSGAPNGVILRNTLENLIQETRRPRSKTAPVPEHLNAARQIIEMRYDEPLSLADLAAAAGISEAHFCTEFRRHFGIPPVAYLLRRRMRAAAALLRGTALSVSEVGRRVGYDDPYYFSKLFKATYGVPPSRMSGTHHPRHQALE